MNSVSRLTICIILFVFSIHFLHLCYYEKYPYKSHDTIIIYTEVHENEYCIGYNYLEAQQRFPEGVALTTHGTSDMVEAIENQAENWDGHISFALFLDFHSRKVLEYIANVHRCHQKFRDKVSVHIASRMSPFQTDCQQIEISLSKVPCEEFIKNQNKYRKEVVSPFQLYPFNVMRNLARRGAKSDLHFIVDGDMIMSEEFALKVKAIANTMIDGKSKKALVIRRFETNEKKVPKTFPLLKEGFDNKTIFEFHHKFWFVGHRIPNITYWFNESEESDDVQSWEIPYLGSQWETPVIIHRNDQYHAEYFPARIRDVHSLIYKLCRANYTYHLLSNVFCVHQGIKTKDTMFSQVVSEHSRTFNKARAFNRYVKEMDDFFPETLARCGKFSM